MNGLTDSFGETLLDLQKENKRLRDALTEIRDVARVSEGVDFYAMLADKALNGDG
jgi:hypothetical protein